jgi:hypothetical protein
VRAQTRPILVSRNENANLHMDAYKGPFHMRQRSQAHDPLGTYSRFKGPSRCVTSCLRAERIALILAKYEWFQHIIFWRRSHTEVASSNHCVQATKTPFLNTYRFPLSDKFQTYKPARSEYIDGTLPLSGSVSTTNMPGHRDIKSQHRHLGDGIIVVFPPSWGYSLYIVLFL